MTDTEINIAIAEVCGWKHYHLDLWVPPQQTNDPDGFSELQCDSLPDYLNDLNAMHEVEKALDDEQWLDYVRCLQEDVLQRWPGKYRQWAALTHATAAQRAEAFLRTIGKWKN